MNEPTVLEMYRELLYMFNPEAVMNLTDDEIKNLWYRVEPIITFIKNN